ncbi:MAG: GntR family transcriptional regulator, partial [Planctomycetaceae bacterium]
MRVQNAQNRIALARTTVTAAATEHLREQIVCGSVPPGETLPETRVGEMLGVSRAPIREALTLLEREGLVEFDRRGTARVCEFELEDVRELGLMRMVLEPAGTRLAAERRAETGLDAIEKNLHALKKVSRLEDVTRLDLDFHRLIFAAAGNKRLM